MMRICVKQFLIANRVLESLELGLGLGLGCWSRVTCCKRAPLSSVVSEASLSC